MSYSALLYAMIIHTSFNFFMIKSSYNHSEPSNELSDLFKDMLLNDPDRAKADDIILNHQRHSNSPQKVDRSNEHFFKYVNPSLLSKPAYRKLAALFDNYFVYTGEREVENSTERQEIDDFLKVVYDSLVFKKMYDFLKAKNHPDARTLRICQTKFRQLWFDFYSRKDGVLDTCSFEHVMVGEITGGRSLRSQKPVEIGGLHNWFRFYQLEKAGLIDYAGFVIKRKNSIALLQYDYLGVWKPSGSFMIGTSPQFDLCAYTLCFLMKPGFKKCSMELNGCQILVTTHALIQKNKTFIGTAFPSPGPTSRTCR